MCKNRGPKAYVRLLWILLLKRLKITPKKLAKKKALAKCTFSTITDPQPACYRSQDCTGREADGGHDDITTEIQARVQIHIQLFSWHTKLQKTLNQPMRDQCLWASGNSIGMICLTFSTNVKTFQEVADTAYHHQSWDVTNTMFFKNSFENRTTLHLSGGFECSSLVFFYKFLFICHNHSKRWSRLVEQNS